VIEHNPDLIAGPDWIVDLATRKSATAQALADFPASRHA